MWLLVIIRVAEGGSPMDESTWLACDSIKRMFEYLRQREELSYSDRKCRFFACACCRRIWQSLTDERSRQSVEVGEAFADGLASDDVREAAVGSALAAADESEGGYRAAEA